MFLESQKGGKGYLEALAKSHNREMHAANGNQFHIRSSSDSFEKVVHELMEKVNGEVLYESSRWTNVFEENETTLKTFYPYRMHIDAKQRRMLDQGCATVQADRIFRQEENGVWPPEGKARPIDKDEAYYQAWEAMRVASRAALTNSTSRAAFSKAAESFTEKAMCRPRNAVRIGDEGYIRNYSHYLHATSTAHYGVQPLITRFGIYKVVNANPTRSFSASMNNIVEDDDDDDKDILWNLKLTTENCRFTTPVDVRHMLLKLRLYELQVAQKNRVPLGVPWAAVPRVSFGKEWVPAFGEMTGIFIDGKYLNALLKTRKAVIETVDKGHQGLWSLNASDTRVVVVDHYDTFYERALELQVIMAAPYPIARLAEWAPVSSARHAESFDLARLLPAASLVEIEEGVKHIIFITTFEELKVKFGGANFRVTTVNASGQMGAVPVKAITNAVYKSLMKSVNGLEPLTSCIQPWLNSRMDNDMVDWPEIDTYATLLSARFIPQPEVVRDNQGNSTTHWVPEAHRDFFTNAAMPCFDYPDRIAQETEYFGHQAVNAVEQAVASKVQARSCPIIYFGEWPVLAEIATGFQAKKLELYKAPILKAIRERAFGAMADVSIRAVLLRLVVELFKHQVGVIDWLVNYSFTSDEKYFRAFASFIESLCGVKTPGALRWKVNGIALVQKTATGIRTPFSGWLNDLSESSPEDSLLENGNYRYSLYGVPDWQVARLVWRAVVGLPKENPQLTAILPRMNPYQLEADDLLYVTHPNLDRDNTMAYRISSSRFAAFSQSVGWHSDGFHDPADDEEFKHGWGIRSYIRTYNSEVEGSYLQTFASKVNTKTIAPKSRVYESLKFTLPDTKNPCFTEERRNFLRSVDYGPLFKTIGWSSEVLTKFRSVQLEEPNSKKIYPSSSDSL